MTSPAHPSIQPAIRGLSQRLMPSIRAALKAAKSPPKLTVSQWADQKRMLSSVSSAEPGRWSTSRQPYQRNHGYDGRPVDPDRGADDLVAGGQEGLPQVLGSPRHASIFRSVFDLGD